MLPLKRNKIAHAFMGVIIGREARSGALTLNLGRSQLVDRSEGFLGTQEEIAREIGQGRDSWGERDHGLHPISRYMLAGQSMASAMVAKRGSNFGLP